MNYNGFVPPPLRPHISGEHIKNGRENKKSIIYHNLCRMLMTLYNQLFPFTPYCRRQSGLNCCSHSGNPHVLEIITTIYCYFIEEK